MQRIVNSLLEDSNGFIWMGSLNGVNVYDGKNYKFYKDFLNENLGFKGMRANHIFEDSKGRILVGMENSGINLFLPETGGFKNYKENLFKDTDSDYLANISENSIGELFIAGEVIIKFGLNKNGELVNREIYKPNLQADEFIKHGLMYNDDYFIVTNKRIISYETKSTIYRSNKIKKCKVRYGKFWILSDWDLGTLDVKTKEFKSVEFDFSETKNQTTDFDFIAPNIAFIGTNRSLLQVDLNKQLKATKITNLQVRQYKRHDRIVSVGVSHIFKDKSDNLYFNFKGSWGGLMKLNKNQLNATYVGLPEPYNNGRYIASAFHDLKGVYWLGTPYGIFAFDSKKNEFLTFSNGSIYGLQGVDVIDFIEDDSGNIWLNTHAGILNFNRENNSFITYNKTAGNTRMYYPDWFLDRDENIWYPTRKGISKFSLSTKETIDYEIGEPSAIYLDKYNVLWVHMQHDALFAYDISNDTIKVIDKHHEFFTNLTSKNQYSPVRQILEDDKDRLWLSGFNGIYIYDYKNRSVIKHINKNNYLEEDNLWEIMKDAKGNFWVKQYTTSPYYFSSETLKVIGRMPSWMNVLPDLRGNNGPIYQDRNGRIFSNGLNGILIFDPENFEIENKIPQVVLTKVSINGEENFSNFIGAQGLKRFDFKHDENSIMLKLKEVGQNNSPFKEFAYRLKGISDEWQYTKEFGEFNYTELSPNTYTLEVKSTSDGKIWSKDLALLTFKIKSPWWKTIYAYLAYILALTVLVYMFYKLQLNKRLAESEAQKLKEVDDFKNVFYQNITHEFRTPLTVILGLTENLKDKTSSTITRNAKQLLKHVNELLEIGQVEANVSKLNIQTQDVVSFSKYCMESLQSLAEQKNIKMNFVAIRDNIPMDFDSNKFQLILNNLLSNAIKFTPEYGQITLKIDEHKTNVIIKIIDDGTGIPKQDLEKVFERYYQTDSTEKSNGSGIGLSLTRELVKLMNGSIHASNNTEKGTCFTMTFPLTTKDKLDNLDYELTTNLSTEELESHEHIILVIEDNKDVMEYVISTLPEKYNVVTAINGKEGIEKAFDIIPDIIISDVMMPLMDGYEVCNRLKTNDKTNHIPIVLLTAKADLKSKIEGITHGADAYLGKPFNKTELLARLDNLISIREKLKAKYSKELSESTTKRTEFSDEFLNRLQNQLLKNIDNEDYGINEICADIGISRTQLHRKIKALTGISTSIFFREIRLKEGFKLLLNSDLTVSEVAYSVGFSDPNYFSKLFTQKYGTAPSSVE